MGAWRRSRNPCGPWPVAPAVGRRWLGGHRVALAGHPVALATAGNSHKRVSHRLPWSPILYFSVSAAQPREPLPLREPHITIEWGEWTLEVSVPGHFRGQFSLEPRRWPKGALSIQERWGEALDRVLPPEAPRMAS